MQLKGSVAATAEVKERRRGYTLGRREALLGLGLLLPSILFQSALIAYPYLRGIWMSFTELYLLKGLDSQHFVGLAQYVKLVQDPKVGLYLKNTFIYGFGHLVGVSCIGLAMALLMNRRVVLRPIWRSLALLPWVMPMPVVGLIWKWILDGQWGVLNGVLLGLGIIEKPIVWMGDTRFLWPVVIFVAVWKGFPFWYVNILAGLQVIPQELYDAAKVDGASTWQQFVHITLAQLRPVLSILFLLGIVQATHNFAMIWVLTQGGPADFTMTLAPLVYVTSMDYYRMGYGAAWGVVLALISLVITIVYLRQVNIELRVR